MHISHDKFKFDYFVYKKDIPAKLSLFNYWNQIPHHRPLSNINSNSLYKARILRITQIHIQTRMTH